MLEETALVTDVKGTSISVRTVRKSACDSCQAEAGCGQKRITQLLIREATDMAIDNPQCLDVRVGSQVLIGLNEGALVRASLILYLLPLVMMILAALVSSQIFHHELWQILSAVTGLLAGFLCGRILSARLLSTGDYRPVLLRVVL
ncbi:SoxR reducing system RseC family protein [Nitrincola alkalilacustris]|uniref:SoxR reducing system RseC family protein n=1 Tax=Nitrincola alkalilacustris TaxID=1571224 RepID=UPI00124DD8EF|nr:SoxR reducing system RseC family protein [Nitrincola alkalilacustris]